MCLRKRSLPPSPSRSSSFAHILASRAPTRRPGRNKALRSPPHRLRRRAALSTSKVPGQPQWVILRTGRGERTGCWGSQYGWVNGRRSEGAACWPEPSEAHEGLRRAGGGDGSPKATC
eukprot:Selendium_serpulae@DN6513_c1_g1_i1.p1